MSTARDLLAGGGTQTSALGFGGNELSESAATEEFTGAGPTTVTISST